MNWLFNPYIDLDFVAEQLYGGRSRLHTRRLQDKLKGRSVFQQWETERLAQLKEQLIANLLREKGIYEVA
ncbi:MAG: hypothetical protein ICV83_29055 [Cytophagales bacterium]|nr:hypothetical protein [Cytophagales bacterium]